ncbi:MAG: bifunctional ornithine acetyltransferase/N-acetylglutamate synthase [Chloroflexi bacterium]|nr:bifunctional ornithine acetyltransferase/N-acetylglutamate synthase [Chloroflexota bacterium]|tara:strand:+ start:7575 stop:8792 length:1218 start_codon:yes stop_codon:yes gene_type:complete
MSTEITLFTEGTVTSPKGYLAGAAYAGIKTYAQNKMDVGILLSESQCVSAGIYTTNKFVSPSVELTRKNINKGNVKGIFVSSGIANAGVGAQGMIDAQESLTHAAAHTSVNPDELAIGTTGVIGVELPMALIRAGIPNIEITPNGGDAFARAIMTTDRIPKSAAIQLEINGRTITIGGCTKGSGMIHPNMATMLAFLTTDATLDQAFLSKELKNACDDTFNMVTIDGDTSTNDMVIILANGAANAKPIKNGTPEADLFSKALKELCDYLSYQLVKDAEGSSKVFSVSIEEAKSVEDARLAARSIASSSLVKSAIHGNDPNWGRVVAAAGYSGADLDVDKVSFFINDVTIMEAGTPIPFHRESVIAIMSRERVNLTLKLGLGNGTATAWGCELTEEYVRFNSAYTT